MAEPGSRKPASDVTEAENLARIAREGSAIGSRGINISGRLRQELEQKGLKGFKKGGRVRKTGVYKLHKGEKITPARKAAAAKPPFRNGKRVASMVKKGVHQHERGMHAAGRGGKPLTRIAPRVSRTAGRKAK